MKQNASDDESRWMNRDESGTSFTRVVTPRNLMANCAQSCVTLAPRYLATMALMLARLFALHISWKRHVTRWNKAATIWPRCYIFKCVSVSVYLVQLKSMHQSTAPSKKKTAPNLWTGTKKFNIFKLFTYPYIWPSSTIIHPFVISTSPPQNTSFALLTWPVSPVEVLQYLM